MLAHPQLSSSNYILITLLSLLLFIVVLQFVLITTWLHVRRHPAPRTRLQLDDLSNADQDELLPSVPLDRSLIPAAKIFSPIADFLFKSVGFTQAAITPSTVMATTYIYGMGAAFAVPLSAIIENSPIFARMHAGNKANLLTSFTHGQLLQIRVSLRPTCELSLQDVLLVPNAVQGTGARTITVNYRARGMNYCCLPHPLSTEIGLVLVGYQDLSRNKGTDFDAEDFGAEIIISGTVRLSNPIPHVGYEQVPCVVHDKLATKMIRVNNLAILNQLPICVLTHRNRGVILTTTYPEYFQLFGSGKQCSLLSIGSELLQH